MCLNEQRSWDQTGLCVLCRTVTKKLPLLPGDRVPPLAAKTGAGSESSIKPLLGFYFLISDLRISLLIGCFCGLSVAVCMARGECLQNVYFDVTDTVPLASCVILSRSFNLCDLFVCKVGVTQITKTEPQSQHHRYPRLAKTAV